LNIIITITLGKNLSSSKLLDGRVITIPYIKVFLIVGWKIELRMERKKERKKDELGGEKKMVEVRSDLPTKEMGGTPS